MTKAVVTRSNGDGIFQAIYPGCSTHVVFGGTSTAVNLFSSGTQLIRVHSAEDCFIAIGNSPTATTTTIFLPADTTEYFCVSGSSDRLAVRDNGTSGVLHITEAL
jgi:hypothetical protein